MLCIQCSSPSTAVTNSRPHKKQPRVWRRRHCLNCGADFTTQEKPALDAKVYVIETKTGQKQPFYQGKIIYAIIRSFAHDEQFGINNALPLSETVITLLLPMGPVIETSAIAETCYKVLLRFDPSAAAQYALTHGMTTRPVRRRKSA